MFKLDSITISSAYAGSKPPPSQFQITAALSAGASKSTVALSPAAANAVADLILGEAAKQLAADVASAIPAEAA